MVCTATVGGAAPCTEGTSWGETGTCTYNIYTRGHRGSSGALKWHGSNQQHPTDSATTWRSSSDPGNPLISLQHCQLLPPCTIKLNPHKSAAKSNSLGVLSLCYCQHATYGGTNELVHGEFTSLGIEHTAVDPADPASWEAAIRPNTKVCQAHDSACRCMAKQVLHSFTCTTSLKSTLEPVF